MSSAIHVSVGDERLSIPLDLRPLKRAVNQSIDVQDFERAHAILDGFEAHPSDEIADIELIKLRRNAYLYAMHAEGLFECYERLAHHENGRLVDIGHMVGSGLLSGQPLRIEATLDVVAEHHPDHERIGWQATLDSRRIRWGPALEAWSSVLGADPQHAAAVYGKAEALTRLHRFEESEEFVNEVLRNDSPNASAHAARILQHKLLYYRQEAVDACLAALEHHPDDVGFLTETVANALQLNELEIASECIQHLEQVVSVPFHAVFPKFNYFVESDRFDEAFEYIDESLQKFPKNALQLRLRRGSLLFHPSILRTPKDIDVARTYIEELYADFSHAVEVKTLLAKLYVFAKDEAAALGMIEQLPEHLGYRNPVKALHAWRDKVVGDLPAARSGWQALIRERDIVPVFSPITDFRRLSEEQTLGPDDIVVFTVVRDEHYRIEAWLDYYRRLGVTKFVAVDNGSTDGTLELLLEQEDTITWATNNSYNQSFNGMRWVNELLAHYTATHNNWSLYVDVDEFIIYPEVEKVGLRTVTKQLELTGNDAVRGFMIDVFDPETFEVEIDGINPLDKELWFYNDYRFDGWEYPPYRRVSGGLRTQLYDDLNIILTKTPIVRGGGTIKFLASSHVVTPVNPAELTCALIHLKYSSRFVDRAKVEAERKVHFRGAKRFKLYYEKREEFQRVLNDRESNPAFQRFTGSEQLRSLGLIQGNLREN